MHLIGGIGSGHDSDAHQVTGCMHGHTHYQQGNLKSGGGSAMSQATQLQMQKEQQDAQFSLSNWLQQALNRSKSILKGIWGTNETNTAGTAGDRTGSAQTMAQVGDSGANGHGTVNGQTAAEHSAAIQGNPYFAAMPEKNAAHMTPFQKVRAKIVAGAEKLAGKLPGRSFRFQAKNSFQAKPEQRPKEDMRKRSKYRKDELEIDCILTDESYLMDSYDRNGEYSQLTTKK
ncbi:MAG: hypothetical protein NC517_10975 [Firmicutes bacterium]|nr:hypothetical protein [Bacillota bacterium]